MLKLLRKSRKRNWKLCKRKPRQQRPLHLRCRILKRWQESHVRKQYHADTDECDTLKRYATNGILFHAENERLKGKLESAQKSASIGSSDVKKRIKISRVEAKAQPFLDALEIASEKVRAFINSILARGKETQEHKAPARKRGQDMEI